jgi:hypothetical protein
MKVERSSVYIEETSLKKARRETTNRDSLLLTLRSKAKTRNHRLQLVITTIFTNMNTKLTYPRSICKSLVGKTQSKAIQYKSVSASLDGLQSLSIDDDAKKQAHLEQNVTK